MKIKKRADEALFAAALAESRTKAQAMILAGEAFFKKDPQSEWQPIQKAGQSLPVEVELKVESLVAKDVGRGAQKLRGALKAWPQIEVSHALALDVGSSTGGFTQVLLEKGARQVLALDVGTHQLHERLRKDPRVISLEQQHVLKMDAAVWARVGVHPCFDVVVTDLSFISLTKILATVSPWLKSGGHWILLVKPQFELEAKKVPGGIVRREEFRKDAVDRVRSAFANDPTLKWLELIESPIQGGDGNKEFLAWIQKK